jgi:type II secretory pathway component GspD/PulD (secretin)
VPSPQLPLALVGLLTAQTVAQLPPLPLTQLDERALAVDLDNRAFTLTFAQPVPIRDLLLLLVRGTSLSIVPDPDIEGSFIGELKNVTVRQALGLILPPLDLDYSVDGSFVRVFQRAPETRIFDINYVATSRAAAVEVGGAAAGASTSRITSTTSGDVFGEISTGVRSLLSGQATFNVDRKAGLLQVTDFPEGLERVANYLEAVHDRVSRQVQIAARVLEVELNDPNAQGLDLAALMPSAGGPSRLLLSGLGPGEVDRFLDALAAVGKVNVLADPHLLALNNETTMVRAVLRRGASGAQEPETAEEGVTLAVTPQMAGDGVVMLSLSPIVGIRVSDGDSRTRAITAVREADTLARVADGETVVVSGFTRNVEVREQTTGRRGGWFGRSSVVTRKRVALVILLTPRVLNAAGAQ